MIKESDLDWIEKTCGCASSGPWRWKSSTNRLIAASGKTVLAFDTGNLDYHPSPADKRFICEASLWMASLVSEVRLLQRCLGEQCPMCNGTGVVRVDNHGAKEEWTEVCQCQNPTSQGDWVDCLEELKRENAALREQLADADKWAEVHREAVEALALINVLRAEEGSGVEIINDSIDFGAIGSRIEVHGPWIQEDENGTGRRWFCGDTLLDCLRDAVKAKRAEKLRREIR